MEEFLRYMVRQLVENPDEVLLTHREENDKIIFRLSLRNCDVGRLIGKGGNTINAIRELLNAAGERRGQKVILELSEPGGSWKN